MKQRGERCEVKGCPRGVYCRGYCRPHYRRLMRGFDPEAPAWSSVHAPPDKLRIVNACVAVVDACSAEELDRALWRHQRLINEIAARRAAKRVSRSRGGGSSSSCPTCGAAATSQRAESMPRRHPATTPSRATGSAATAEDVPKGPRSGRPPEGLSS